MDKEVPLGYISDSVKVTLTTTTNTNTSKITTQQQQQQQQQQHSNNKWPFTLAGKKEGICRFFFSCSTLDTSFVCPRDASNGILKALFQVATLCLQEWSSNTLTISKLLKRQLFTYTKQVWIKLTMGYHLHAKQV